MSNVMNPDGTHKVIAGYSHTAGLQERDRRITELEAVIITLHKQRADMYKRIDEQQATIAKLKTELYEEAAICAEQAETIRRKERVISDLDDMIKDALADLGASV